MPQVAARSHFSVRQAIVVLLSLALAMSMVGLAPATAQEVGPAAHEDLSAWLDPGSLVAGYAAPVAIEAFGGGTSWTQADTVVSIIDTATGGEIAGAVGDVTVSGPEQLVFNLTAQLGSGFYEVAFTTGTEVASAYLDVGDPFAWLDPSFVAEGYATPAAIGAFGEGTSWTQADTVVSIIDPATGGEIAGAVGNVSVSGPEQLVFDLQAQLGLGFYEVIITTGDQVVLAYLEVGEQLIFVWPSQIEPPYDPPLPIDVSGQGTSFTEGTTQVEILNAAGEPVSGAVSNVAVWGPGSLTFDLAVVLSPGDYQVQVTTGAEQLQALLQVIDPGPCGTLDVPLPEQNTGLTNMGFESGDFTHWSLGRVTETVAVTGADTFTSPWEGAHMAVLGAPAEANTVNQVPGPNEICQDFVVTDATAQFSYNLFTYDYTGYDQFRFDLQVTNPATGEVLASQRQEAWGTGTELKSTGWKGAVLDLAGHVGETVRLTISAGGTSDQLYPFWAYVDSADELPPVPPVTVTNESGSVMVDPVTGQTTVAMPFGAVSDVTVTVDLADPECLVASAVLLYGGIPYTFSPVGEGSTTYSGTIPAQAILDNPGDSMVIEVTCEEGTTQVTAIGTIVLYDPSGIVSDAVTGEPVVGAEVFLHKVPEAVPDETVAGDGDCRTVDTRDGTDWTNEPDASPGDGELVNPASPEISPNVNPFITNNIGYYGWDVALGCWYVVVEAEGYQTRYSPIVGVPPEVTDLDLTLTPLAVDITPPAWPTAAALTVSDVTQSSVHLSWPAANDDTAVTGYRVFRDGTQVAEVATDTTSLQVSGLTPDTTYTFAVQAFDEVGNESADGPTATATTLAVPDTAAPSWSAGADLGAADVTETSVELSWPAASDDSAVAGYRVYQEPASAASAQAHDPGTLIADQTGTTLQVSGLAPDTAYEFTVEAYDAAGNESHDGPSTTVTTLPDAVAPEDACPAGEVPATPFTDIANNTHEDTIACIFWYGVTQGTTATTYSPANRVRRDQMASFIARTMEASGVTLPAPSDQGFGDIDGNVHEDRINQLAAIGVTQGITPTAYAPSQEVRRDQMASFLVRAYEIINDAELAREDSPFTDVAGNTHLVNIEKAATAGFTLGTTATTYSPRAPVRRDQMGSFLARVLERGMDDGHVSLPDAG